MFGRPAGIQNAAIIAICIIAASPVARASLVEGYTNDVSYVAGDTISFHVSTFSPAFDLEIIRVSWTPEVVDVVTDIPGEFRGVAWTEEAQLWLGVDWPASYVMVVPENWPTGSYLARFITSDDGTEAFRPFVIRTKRPGEQSRVAFLTNYNTKNAYNGWGGASLYKYTFSDDLLRTTHVSFHRPYNIDQGRGHGYAVSQNVANQLEEDGFAPEYLAELDLHRNPSLIQAYDVVVLAGHHEYVCKPMYDALEAFHARGGHLAFFSANDIWWQVRFEGDGLLMVSYKQSAIPDDPMYGVDNSLVTTNWFADPVNRPGEALQGISYSRSLPYDGADFLIQDSSHWAFAGTGLQTGDPLGSTMATSETDYFAAASPPVLDVLLWGRRYYSGTDPGFDPYVDAVATYYEDTASYGFPGGRGGQVFSAGCEGAWGLNLWSWRVGYENVRIVTSNIVRHMADTPMDCNTNGLDDATDLASCSAGDTMCADCNSNSVPDACDLLNCPSGIPSCADCNSNGVLDGCEINSCSPNDPGCSDCNGNGVPDGCDIATCSAGDNSCSDCDGNGVPDGCEPDCNANGIADACDIATCTGGDTSCSDCDGNGVPDGCEPDCNRNGIADACDIADCPGGDASCTDCNGNSIPDGCEEDFDGDTLIDACDPDIDGDGVANAGDICDFTPTGVQVRADGSANGDIDADCDVDLHDFAAFQPCFRGASVPVTDPSCSRAKIDADSDVDADDFTLFEATLVGS